MASTSPLVSRNASFTNLSHALRSDRPCPVLHHHQLLSVLQETKNMKRSISAPCLSKASRFVISTQKDSSSFEEQQTSLLSKEKSEMQQAQASMQQRAAPAVATPVVKESRFASLSRVLLVSQPSNMFRNLANRKWPSAVGPISLLVFLFGTLLAILAAVRSALVRKVKSCKCCKGFGVVRCRLCDGKGSVDWRAKFSYSEQCPLCMAKRFVVCPDCGGHYHRRLFSHAKPVTTEGGEMADGAVMAAAGAGAAVGNVNLQSRD